MNITGAASTLQEIINPDALTGEEYRVKSRTVVQGLKRKLVVGHWAFVDAMSEILPYALEAISPTDSECNFVTPELNAPEPGLRPKAQLSGAASVNLYRTMIFDDRLARVPAITFAKYSISTTGHPVADVSVSGILEHLKTWTNSHLTKYANPIDYSDIAELSILAFLEKGFELYSGVGIVANQRQYYRIAFLKNDMFVEMILTMDDLMTWGDISRQERKTVVC